jgi:glycosyltransferase involved in cell wall biosynthesis
MLFSVVVCTYNRSRRLEKALASVLGQDAARQGTADFELVVVDDGSDDDTAAVVAAAASPRIRYVWRPNGGLSAARNTGITEARGDFVIFLDDDDRPDPAWLSTLAAAIDDTTGVVSCGCWMHGPGDEIGTVKLPAQLAEAFDNVRALFLAGTFAARRTLYERVGGYAEDIPTSHQTEIALRLLPEMAKLGLTVATVDRPLVHIERRDAHDRIWRPSDLLAGTEYLLDRHGPRLASSPAVIADYHAVAGVSAFQVGDRTKSRRHFRAAVRADPTSWRHAGRYALAHAPGLGRRVWLRGAEAAPVPASPASASPTASPPPSPPSRASAVTARVRGVARLSRPAALRGIVQAQRSGRVREDADHLADVVGWLGRAQDATPDGGVAASYSLADGWNPPYPETTGYIVPTLLHHAEICGDDESRRRAGRMGAWLADVQRADGSIGRGLWAGPADTTAKPAEVFNTGQVLFAYVSLAGADGGDERMVAAATRAAAWLHEHQNADGSWTAHSLHGVAHSYYTRVAWALARAGRVLDEPAWSKAALQAAEWAVGLQRDNGWIDLMAFAPGSDPLTHTVAYTIEGLLECGLVLDSEPAWAAGVAACDAVARSYHMPDGCRLGRGPGLAATLTADWRGSASYECPTGSAQLALCCQRVADIDGRADLRWFADELMRSVKLAQAGPSSPPTQRGGVPGSMPIWGRYASFRYLNWAAKFTADALLDRVGGGLPRLRYG